MGRREHRCGKRPFWERFFLLKPIILPRQAWDKHRKNSKKKACCAEYGFTDVCEKQFGDFTYPDDDSAGPCFFMSLFGPDTPWNAADSEGKYLDTAGSLAALLEKAEDLEAAHPDSPVPTPYHN